MSEKMHGSYNNHLLNTTLCIYAGPNTMKSCSISGIPIEWLIKIIVIHHESIHYCIKASHITNTHTIIIWYIFNHASLSRR